MGKITKAYNTARKLALALGVLAGVGAALWRLTENTRLKKLYMDTWQADAARIHRAVAEAESKADAASPQSPAENPQRSDAPC